MEIIKKERLYNRSKVYIVPCLQGYIPIEKEFLIDSFIFERESDKSPKIFLKYKWFDNFAEYEAKVIKSDLFEKSIDYDDNHLILVLNIPKEFESDVDKFLKGKYSELSEKLKVKIIKFWELTTKSVLYKVLTKNETLREQMSKELNCEIPKNAELSSKPEIKSETLYEQ